MPRARVGRKLRHPARRNAVSSRHLKPISNKPRLLVLVEHPPEANRGAGPRRNYEFLTRLSRLRGIDCLAVAPPVAVKVLKQSLSECGIDLLQDWAVPENRDLFPLVRNAVSSKTYAAVIVVGSELCERTLLRLRLQQPRQTIIGYFPLEDGWVDSIYELSAMAREEYRNRLGALLRIADAIWVPSVKSAAIFNREFSACQDGIMVLPGRGFVPAWLNSELDRLSVKRDRIASRPVSLLSRESVPEINKEFERHLKQKSHMYAPLHDWTPSTVLLEALAEGMAMLSHAGAAIPIPADPRSSEYGGSTPGLTKEQAVALWHINKKGDWQAWPYSDHFCGAMIRGEAAHSIGLLDERFVTPHFAWIDYLFRLEQAGWSVFLAKDCLSFCGAKRDATARRNARDREFARDAELLTDKWSRGSLRMMEILGVAIEPGGYRDHPETHIALGGKHR